MNKKGFSFIELIITVSLISILTIAGVAGYTQFDNREKLKQTALDIRNVLRDMQVKVASSEKDKILCGTNPLSYWRMRFNTAPCNIPANKNYLVDGFCGAVSFSPTCYRLPDNYPITLTASHPLNTNIHPPYGFTCVNGIFCTNPTYTIRVKNNAIGKCLDVIVNPKGEVAIGSEVSC